MQISAAGGRRSGPARTRLALIAAAIVVVGAVVITAVVFRPGRETRAEPRVPLPSDKAAPAAVAGQMPASAPSGVSWSLVGQVAVPSSVSEGPTAVSGCQVSGFAHSTVGALIAAAQISSRAGYSAGRRCWEPVIGAQFVPSPDRETLLKTLNDAEAGGVPVAGPGELAQLVAFRYLSYTGDTAVVGLIRRSPRGTLAQTTLTVTWSGGDWKLVAPPGGAWPALTAEVASMSGAVSWGAS